MTDLTKKENWTPELLYIHRSRLVIGAILGLLLGFNISFLIYLLINHS